MNNLILRIIAFVILIGLHINSWGAPVIQDWLLENGARVYFSARPELPMVDFKVVFAAGSAYDDPGHSGRATLTNSLLDQGAGAWSADTFAAELAQLGAHFRNGTQQDMAVVSLRTLNDQAILERAADLFATALSQPNFPEDACARTRAQNLTALAAEQQDPSSVAIKAFYRAIYGTHPYSQADLGTPETVARLTRADIVDFYRRFYVGSNAILVIVGALDRPGAEALARRIIGSLPQGIAPPPLPPVADIAMSQEKITFPSSQTHILSGQPGIGRSDPDYFPLYLGNHILGGNGLVSRISDEIREKRALSYSAYSKLTALRVAGPFLMGLQTRQDQADAAREVLQKLLEEFVRTGPTEEELVKAQQNITGGFALRLDSNRKILDYLAIIGFYHLPLDYLEHFSEQIMAVTTEQIRSAFQRRIHPAHLATIIVGK